MTREEAIEVIEKMATDLQITPDSTQGQAIQQAIHDMNFIDKMSYLWEKAR